VAHDRDIGVPSRAVLVHTVGGHRNFRNSARQVIVEKIATSPMDGETLRRSCDACARDR
jgi:hypothetical protein